MPARRSRLPRLGVPELAVLAALVLLVAGALLLGGGGEEEGGPPRTTVSPQRLARVERAVEQIRGLRFRRPVRVEVMTPEETRRYGVAESARETTAAQTAADGELAKLLGTLAPDVDLDAVTSDLFGEQVAGFYDPRNGRLVLVDGVGIDDVTLAHELTHALEDQQFDLQRLGDPGRGAVVDGDAAIGESGLVEGTATAVMTRYLQQRPDALTLGEAFGQLLGASGGRPLPPSIMRTLLFPYQAGERFVDRLYRTTGDWRLVDNALRDRPPASSAELYDPTRWLRVTRPEPVALPPAGAPGAGWRRVRETTFGELDLRELLHDALGGGAAGRVGERWAGGRVALWRRGPLPAPDCAAPCRARDALALRLRLDSPAAARATAAALSRWLSATLRAEPAAPPAASRPRRAAAPRAYRLPGGSAGLLAVGGREVRVALAPDGALAARLLR